MFGLAQRRPDPPREPDPIWHGTDADWDRLVRSRLANCVPQGGRTEPGCPTAGEEGAGVPCGACLLGSTQAELDRLAFAGLMRERYLAGEYRCEGPPPGTREEVPA